MTASCRNGNTTTFINCIVDKSGRQFSKMYYRPVVSKSGIKLQVASGAQLHNTVEVISKLFTFFSQHVLRVKLRMGGDLMIMMAQKT